MKKQPIVVMGQQQKWRRNSYQSLSHTGRRAESSSHSAQPKPSLLTNRKTREMTGRHSQPPICRFKNQSEKLTRDGAIPKIWLKSYLFSLLNLMNCSSVLLNLFLSSNFSAKLNIISRKTSKIKKSLERKLLFANIFQEFRKAQKPLKKEIVYTW